MKLKTLQTLLQKPDIREIDEIQPDKIWYYRGEDTLSLYVTKSSLEKKMKAQLFQNTIKTYYFQVDTALYASVVLKEEGEVPYIGPTEYDSLLSAYESNFLSWE